MTRLSVLFFACLVFFSACSNPADNASKAIVTDASTPAVSIPIKGTALPFAAENSSIEFIGSKMTGIENCSFKKFSGTVDLVADKPEQSSVRVAIDLNSVEAKVGKLTEHLKSADFFDVVKFSKATFTSSEIKSGGEKGATHTVTGTLDLHGFKKTLTFPATIKMEADAVSVASEFAVNRKDFGLVYPGKADDLIRDEVLLKLAVKAPRR